MSEREDWNKKIIEEFRSNEGKVGGMFEGMPILLVHHTGAKTGTERVNPWPIRSWTTATRSSPRRAVTRATPTGTTT